MSILHDEVIKPEYDGLTDKEVADELNAINRRGPIPSLDVKRYLHISGKWAGIRAASLGGSNQIVALTFIDGLDTFEVFDLDNKAYSNAVIAQLEACIAVGLLNDVNKTAILALTSNRTSRAQQLGLEYVREGHVTRARNE